MISPIVMGKAVVQDIYKYYCTPTVKAEVVDSDRLCVDTAVTEQVD